MSRDVLAMFVNAAVGGEELSVYNAVPFKIRRFEIYPMNVVSIAPPLPTSRVAELVMLVESLNDAFGNEVTFVPLPTFSCIPSINTLQVEPLRVKAK